jgi:hypothetical protein
VAWIGTPGIGKSNGFNYVLMEFLEHIGEPGWPDTVLLRIPNRIYQFKLNDGKIAITSIPGETLRDVESHCDGISLETSRAVLLLEMDEHEVNPTIGSMPVLVSLSASEGTDTLKTYSKSGVLWMLIAPMSLDEVEEATLLMYYLSRVPLRFINETRLATMQDITVDDILKEIRKRYPWVGGKLRELFGSAADFGSHRSRVKALTLRRDDLTVDIFNMPKGSKFYLSSFIKPGVVEPRYGASYTKAVSPGFEMDPDDDPDGEVFYFDFLTPKLASMFLSKPLDEYQEMQLYSLVPNSVVAELLVISQCLCVNKAEDRQGLWQVFRDPGYRQQISATADADEDFQLRAYSHEDVRTFDGIRISVAVEELDDRMIYRSTAHNLHIADVITVDHSPKKKMLYLHSVMLSRLDNHGVKVSTLSRVLSGMGIFGRSQDYDVTLLCYQDWTCQEPPTGCLFFLGGLAPVLQPERGVSGDGPLDTSPLNDTDAGEEGTEKGSPTTEAKAKAQRQSCTLEDLRSAYDNLSLDQREKVFGAVNPHKLHTRIVRTKLLLNGVPHLLGTGTGKLT